MENNEKEMEIITTEEDIYESDPENNENKKYDEARVYYVYEHIRLDKMEPFYIGKGKGERAYDLYRNDHHDAITDEYGHAVVIIADNLTEEEAFELERDTIEDYIFNLGYGIDIKGYDDYDHELPHLTNMTFGGEGPSGISPWNKGKKGLFHHSEEAKQRISESEKGRKRSEETKQRMSESHKGKVAWNKGKKGIYHHSDETKLIMSESRNGEKNPMYGLHHSEETKLKMSKKVICITTGKKFDSQTEAGNYYKCSHISDCCKGIRKTAGKLNGTPLKWKYLKDYDDEFNGILINSIIE